MKKQIDLETLVASVNKLEKKRASKKEESSKDVKPELKETSQKEPEAKKVEKSARDQDWKKIGTMFRSAKFKEEEQVEQKLAPRINLEEPPTLEKGLDQTPLTSAKPPDEEKSAYLPNTGLREGPYAPRESNPDDYMTGVRNLNSEESTKIAKLQQELKLASHLATERASEEGKVRQEKVYDSLRSRTSNDKETQKYKRLERF